jgi:hypothetical protein
MPGAAPYVAKERGRNRVVLASLPDPIDVTAIPKP